MIGKGVLLGNICFAFPDVLFPILYASLTTFGFLTNHGKFRSYLHKMKDVFANLQLSWKGATNGQPPYDTVQPVLTQSPSSTAQSSPTSDPKASHTHRQRLKLPQQHPPLASRITGRKSGTPTTPQQRHDNNGPQYLSNWHLDPNESCLCKYPVEYLVVKHGL
jgi:hypothetical protein